MRRLRSPLLLAAAVVLTGCGSSGFLHVGGVYHSHRHRAPACAPAGRIVIETTAVAAPVAPHPVYNHCPFCEATTVLVVDRSLDLHTWSCGACPTVVYAWPDGAAWARRRCDDGWTSYRLHGQRAVRVERVPFAVHDRAPAGRRYDEPAGPRTRDRRYETVRAGHRHDRRTADERRHPDRDGVRMVGHPVVRPAAPTGRPGHPAPRASHPAPRPAAPAARPSHPAARPSHPAPRPAPAATRPSHPAPRPAHPAARPSHPAPRPGRAVERPGRAVERPAAPAPRPGRASAATRERTGAFVQRWAGGDRSGDASARSRGRTTPMMERFAERRERQRR